MNKFEILIDSIIIGIIDVNGVAHSQQFDYKNIKTHGDIFPINREKRWRWDFDNGITTSIYADTFEAEDGDIIRNHLRREYGIRFMKNGFHDIDYFDKKLETKNGFMKKENE